MNGNDDMKIDKKMLLKVVNEEVQRSRIVETGEMIMLDPADLIAFANAWRDLGEVIQQQVESVLDLGPEADANENAIDAALTNLQGFNNQLDEALQGWLDETRGEGPNSGGSAYPDPWDR